MIVNYKNVRIDDYCTQNQMFENCAKRFLRTSRNEVVLSDSEKLAYESRFDHDPWVRKVRGILKSIQQYDGRMTVRQKWCLCRFLVMNHPKYEIDQYLDDVYEVSLYA